MFREELSRRDFHRLASMLILGAVLAACTPEGQAQETKPAVTQTIDDLDSIPTVTNTVEIQKTSTPENTPTINATATPEITTTPEAMTQAEIRAEILAAGVNLDDLASSRDEWTSSYMYLEDLQNDIDHLNFDSGKEGWVTAVVIDVEGVTSQEEFDQALVTDGGWKILSYLKVAYKMANGDWQIIKVPLMAYSMEDEVLWNKMVYTISGQYIDDKETTIEKIENILTNPRLSMDRYWELSNQFADYHSGIGSFIKLFTAWPEDPKYANNDCIVGEPPRYTEEQLVYFRETGDPSIFGYQDSDGYYILWPLVTFNADISQLANYNQE